jgi:CheY-like chemotaxis protein
MARVLVVDDHMDSVEPMCKFLEKSGYNVDCAANGNEALEHILLVRPDLIILDLCMPQLDGCSFLEILRSYLRLQSLPVVVLTAVGEGPLLDRARRLHVNAILIKGKATFDEITETARTELHRMSS